MDVQKLQIIWKIRDGILKMSEDLQGGEAGDDTNGVKTKLAENEKRKSKLSSQSPAHFKSHSLRAPQDLETACQGFCVNLTSTK